MNETEPYEHLLGRKAYEAYARSTDWHSPVNNDMFPSFDNTPPAVQKGWIAAGIELDNFIRKEVLK